MLKILPSGKLGDKYVQLITNGECQTVAEYAKHLNYGGRDLEKELHDQIRKPAKAERKVK